MKKLLIGCGCLVLLVLGGGAWVAWQFVPAVQNIQGSMESAALRMDALDEQHAFDVGAQTELDAERFARSLELRVSLKDDYARWQTGMDSYGEDTDWTWRNWIEKATGAMDMVAQQFELLPAALEGEGMGPSEFIWHSRVLWSALDGVAAGAGGPELDPLRGKYDEMRGAYGQIKQQNQELPPTFEELVGDIDPAFALTARQVLAADPLRAEAALGEPSMEVLLMGLPEMLGEVLREADSDVQVTINGQKVGVRQVDDSTLEDVPPPEPPRGEDPR